MGLRIGLLTACLFGICSTASAQTLATYNFTGQSGDVTTSVAPTVAAGGAVTAISRGSGVTAGPGTLNTFTAAGFTPGADLAGAIAANDYLSFTVTANAGNTIRVSSLFLRVNGSASAPLTLVLQSSLTGFGTGSTNTIATAPVTTTVTGQTLDLSGLNQALLDTNASSVELRVYGFGAGTEIGNFNLNQLGADGDAVTLNGSFVPVPEPGSILGVGALVLGGTGLIRRQVRKRDGRTEVSPVI